MKKRRLRASFLFWPGKDEVFFCHNLFHSVEKAVVVNRGRHFIGEGFDMVGCTAHRNAQACFGKHADIVSGITECNDILPVQTFPFEDFFDAVCLVGSRIENVIGNAVCLDVDQIQAKSWMALYKFLHQVWLLGNDDRIVRIMASVERLGGIIEQGVKNVAVFGELIHRVEVIVDVCGVSKMHHQAQIVVGCQLNDAADILMAHGACADHVEIAVQNITAVDQNIVIKCYFFKNVLHLVQRAPRCGSNQIACVLQAADGSQRAVLDDVFFSLIQSPVHIYKYDFPFHF